MASNVSSRHKRRQIQKKMFDDSVFYEDDAEQYSSATEMLTSLEKCILYNGAVLTIVFLGLFVMRRQGLSLPTRKHTAVISAAQSVQKKGILKVELYF
jgi:hypothetical protein